MVSSQKSGLCFFFKFLNLKPITKTRAREEKRSFFFSLIPQTREKGMSTKKKGGEGGERRLAEMLERIEHTKNQKRKRESFTKTQNPPACVPFKKKRVKERKLEQSANWERGGRIKSDQKQTKGTPLKKKWGGKRVNKWKKTNLKKTVAASFLDWEKQSIVTKQKKNTRGKSHKENNDKKSAFT